MPRTTLNNSRGRTTKAKGFVAHSPQHDSRTEIDPDNPDYQVVEVIRSNKDSHMRQILANGNINDYFGLRPEGREQMFPDNMGFDHYEHEIYESRFRKFRNEVNKGRKKNRNKEFDADHMRKSRNYCPEQVIFQVGRYDGITGKYEGVSPELLIQINDEFLEWRKETFPLVMSVGRSVHKDEASTHIQMHDIYTYNAVDEEGEEYQGINQGKCLEQMGVELPPPEYLEALKKRGKGKTDSSIARYYNTKTTYTAICREKMQEICLEHGVELITEKLENAGRSMNEYKCEQNEITRQYLEKEKAKLEEEKKTYRAELEAEIKEDKETFLNAAAGYRQATAMIEQAEGDLNDMYMNLFAKMTNKEATDVQVVKRSATNKKAKSEENINQIHKKDKKGILLEQLEADIENMLKPAEDEELHTYQ